MFSLIRIFLSLGVPLAFSGCLTVERPKEPLVRFEQVRDRNYNKGEAVERAVGESMIRVRDFWQRATTSENAMAPDVTVSGHYNFWSQPAFDFTLPQGEPLRVLGSTAINGVRYRIVELPKNPFAGLLIDESGRALSPRAAFIGGHWTESTATVRIDQNALFRPFVSISADSAKPFLNYELIFTGMTKDAISISYREFTPDELARPSFYQSLTYTNQPNQIIRFKSLRVELISADNETIRFRVLED